MNKFKENNNFTYPSILKPNNKWTIYSMFAGSTGLSTDGPDSWWLGAHTYAHECNDKVRYYFLSKNSWQPLHRSLIHRLSLHGTESRIRYYTLYKPLVFPFPCCSLFKEALLKIQYLKVHIFAGKNVAILRFSGSFGKINPHENALTLC